jgi:thiamine biosynthesis lipoprotein
MIALRSFSAMGTVVSIQVVGRGRGAETERSAALARAAGWFQEIERRCSRFDPASEIMRLAACAGEPVPVSPIVFEAVRFALAVAEASGGAFDPTVGFSMEQRGFNRNDRTGAIVRTPLDEVGPVSYRDVDVDPERRTIALARPVILDLGAVVKGLAIDMAARELRPFEHYAIDAGGDLYLAGHNQDDEPWSVGIRHPRDRARLVASFRVSDRAVCTSGDYERQSPIPGGGHHISDPRTGRPSTGVASVTVLAPTAMLADAVSTAAFVLGPAKGLPFLERQGVEGVMVSTTLDVHSTRGLCDDSSKRRTARGTEPRPTILPDAEGTPHRRPGGPRRARGAGRRAPAGSPRPR